MLLTRAQKFIALIFILNVPYLMASEDEKDDQKKDFYHFNLDLTYNSLARSIVGHENLVESKINDVLNGSFAVTFFPGDYNIKLGLSKSISDTVDSGLYNPLNHDDDVTNFSFSVSPYYDKDYGGLALFYTSVEQNSQYKNKTNDPMGLYKYSNTGLNLVQVAPSLPAGDSYQSKEEVSYLGVKYLLPESKFLPKGANIYHSIMDRTIVYLARFSGTATEYFDTSNGNFRLLHVSDKGKLYGFGIQRSLDDLPLNKFSLDLLQISKGGFTGFPDIDLSEFTIGVTYRAENWYVKLVALKYIAHQFKASFDNKDLLVPIQSDILGSIHIGYSF